MALEPSDMGTVTFAVEGLPEDLRVVRFDGSEAMSELFRYELELAAEEGDIGFSEVLGRAASLTIAREDGRVVRYLHGIVARFEQGPRGNRFTTYWAELVPFSWLLGQRYNCRIFQELSVPDIIKQVLGDAQVSPDFYRLELSGTYDPREYCVQYRESDLNFISRLMEDEGIFYLFQHTEDGPVMVIGDNASAIEPLDPVEVPFHEQTGTTSHDEHIFAYRYAEAVRPGTYTLRDFNFKKPALNLESTKTGEINPELEVYDFPGEYYEPDPGQRLADLRWHEQQAPRQTGAGESVCRRLLPGHRFRMTDHPRDDFNGEQIVVRLTQTCAQPQVLEEGASSEGSSYSNQFESIPGGVQFRPPRTALKPVVEGVQTAFVVGPQGEEIYTDEFGRIKVQFHWDRLGSGDENSSCWVRVGQAWAGAAWGALFLPRIGQEVMVHFVEGDPDRPIVVGAVYHGTNRPPYKLPDEKTKSTIKSCTSKGGGGANEIRFEDKAGAEQFYLHAEKDLDHHVKADARMFVGNDHHLLVKRDSVQKVERDEHSVVQRDQVSEVSRDLHLKVGDKQAVEVGGSYSLKVSGDVMQRFQSDCGQEVGGKLYLKGMNVVIEGMSSLTIKVGGSFVKLDPGGVTIVGSMVKINSGGSGGSGSMGSPVPPMAPIPVLEVPGTGAVDVSEVDLRPSHREPTEDEEQESEEELTWIEVELVDDDDQPIAGEKFEVTTPDGKVATGTTGPDGVGKIRGIKPGNCQITFPNLDKDAWEKA